jgi:cupin fold WbuC family metalloprotein
MKSTVQIIDSSLFKEVLEKSKNSPRKRANHNFHELTEVYQRFLNVLQKDTYVQPHRHLTPPKPETFIVLKGRLGFLIFDDKGNIQEKYILEENSECIGIDIQPGVWHSIVCLSDTCICFEGKSGPYDPSEDKIFADWAPSEAEESKMVYLKKLEKEFI